MGKRPPRPWQLARGCLRREFQGLGWGVVQKGAGAPGGHNPESVDLQIHPVQKRAKVVSSKVGGPGQVPGLPRSESIRASKWQIQDMTPGTLAGVGS